MTIQSERFQHQHDEQPPSIDELLKRKQQAMGRQRKDALELEERARAKLREYHDTQHAYETGVLRYVNPVLEFFGYGLAYRRKRALRQAAEFAAKLDSVSQMSLRVTQEFAEEASTLREESLEHRVLFGANRDLYDRYQQEIGEEEATLDALRKASLGGIASTAEAVSRQRKLLQLKNDVQRINYENNDLAVRIKAADISAQTIDTYVESMQDRLVTFEDQRARFQTLYRVAAAEERVLSSVRGLRSIEELFAQAVVVAASLSKVQDPALFGQRALDRDMTLSLPESKRHNGTPGVPYWVTVAPDILGSYGNGKH